MKDTLKKSSLALLALAFVNLGYGSGLYAAETTEDEADEEDKIVITGSRIKRSEMEGASPVTVITAEDIEAEGFTTVYEALRSLTEASGTVQGEQFTNSFTPNAMMINLRGLGPGYTLVLLNGRRVADYPMPYNSQSNFFNLAQIPAAAIEKIEVLSGGASAIYGSDAVAGVINITTKTEIEDISVNLRMGTTEEGGGDTVRFQAVGGLTGDDYNWTWAFEYYDVDPVFGNDRDYLDDYTDNPGYEDGDPIVNTRSLLYMNYDFGIGGWAYVDPGASTCDAFVDLEYSFRENRGNYCGRDSVGDQTLRSKRTWVSLYNNFSYDLNEDTQLNASVMFWDSEAKVTGFRLWWGSPGPSGYFLDDNAGTYAYLQRIFQPVETGPQSALFNEQSIDLSVGINGMIGEYDYDVTLSHSLIDFERERTRFKEEAVSAYFMGDALGTSGPYTWYAPNLARFYTPLTPADIADLTGIDDTGAESENTTLTASLSGDLFEMPHGFVQFAAIAEYTDQSYDINLHPRLLNQDGEGWWGLTGTGGGGGRNHSALGAEIRIPLLDTLTTTVAARYDDYEDVGSGSGGVGGASTYNIGFEWRPTDELLIRSLYATSFRAPDMHYVYAEESGFYTTVTDYYGCLIDDDPENNSELDCDIGTQIFATREGNPGLEEEEGKSYSFGIVYEPIEELFLSLDYYKVRLENKITDASLDELLRLEANCRTGQADPTSAGCMNAYDRITRIPDDGSEFANELLQMSTDPINSELAESDGIDARITYSMDTKAGYLTYDLAWSHVLGAYDSESPRDPAKWRDDPWNFNARSKVRFTMNLATDDWNFTLLANRVGSLPNWGETDRIKPTVMFNGYAGYSIDEHSTVSLSIQNLFNTRPPIDETFTSWPYFWRGQYSAIGREVFLTYSYTF